ncbi:MAG: type I-A CRISPR-associated protein Cas7/Csa2 [Thermofilum sp.]|nr:type I-A CRISPR-associated protein Cas7/Csa2 [Thermofilum sp.]
MIAIFVRLTGRVEVNAATLNAQGTAGNLIELTKVRVVRFEDGAHRLIEVPAVSGNTVKHWHFVHFVDAYTMLGGKTLCEYCRRGIGFRSPDKNKESEEDFVKGCAGEDVHGFLQPDRQVRRESLFKSSFMLPIEDVETGFDTVTHNRIVVNEQGKIEEKGMMIFKRQYSSSIYGFLMSLDLGYVGKLLYSKEHRKIIDDDDEILKRGKAALIAVLLLLSGDIGASRARALPAWRVKELLVAWSYKPIPQLMHGYYSDYVVSSLGTLVTYSKLLNVEVNVLSYGVQVEPLEGEKTRNQTTKPNLKIETKNSWQDIIEELVKTFEESFNKQGSQAATQVKKDDGD